jgi:hypothetical protein
VYDGQSWIRTRQSHPLTILQYVGGTENTLPFDKVPDAVVKARNLIQTRIKQALHKDVSFNEVLRYFISF